MALLDIRFRSETLDLSLGMNVIFPKHPEAWKEPPAMLYLLHGLSDDHTIWSRRTSIERYAQDYNLTIVMPDAYKSFYCDMMHGSGYWNFFTEELPSLVHRWFNVSREREKTFVAGLSMGGYGAMMLALAHPDRYAAAASLSGALDIAAHMHDEWGDSKLGTFEAIFGNLEKVRSSTNDLVAQLRKLAHVPETDFYVCVGTEDFLYQDSVAFCEAASEVGLHLVYEESAGEHEWGFWDTHIQRVLEWLPLEKLENSKVKNE